MNGTGFPVRKLVVAWLLCSAVSPILVSLAIVLPAVATQGMGLTVTGLFLAPVFGLVLGPFMAPISLAISIAFQLAVIAGLFLLGRRTQMARHWWFWSGTGSVAGTIVGVVMVGEMDLLAGQALRIVAAAAATGGLCANLARHVMPS